MPVIEMDIDDMTEKQVRDLLTVLMEKLDDLDLDDFFGTEGWRHYLGFED
jgi:hypothetical protein